MGNNLAVLKLFAVNKSHPDMRVVVTGASSGIGKEIAIQYARRGYKLVISGRDRKSLSEVQTSCLNLGCKQVEIVITNVNIQSDCEALIESAVKILGGIDILVLCAGVSAYQLFSEAKSLKIYHDLMQTNFFGYLYCTFAAFKHIKESKGQILVISSVSGEIGLPYRSAYCASKFAVTGFFESLRSEIDDDIAITIVCPPSVKTNLRDNSLIKFSGEQINEESRITVEGCVTDILAAADRRARKIYFPLKVYIAAYLRPFAPDFVDRKLKKAAKL